MRAPLAECILALTLLALPVPAAQPRTNADRLGRILTEGQREQVRQAMAEQRGELRELEQRITRLHREIEDAVFARELDEATLRVKVREMAEAQAERMMHRARVIAKLRPSLTDEQLERLKGIWDAAPRMRRGQRPAPSVRPPATEREGSDLPQPRSPAPSPPVPANP